jgi:hypothetical protein
MRGERYALRAGEYLVGRACRRLPARIRQERYQEWLAELPAILRDRDTGPARRLRRIGWDVRVAVSPPRSFLACISWVARQNCSSWRG